MAKYKIEADTDTGTYAYSKDDQPIDHSDLVMSSYMTCDYDNKGNRTDKRRVYFSHKTEKNGVHETHDVAFYLGEPQLPNTPTMPNYDVPQAVAKIIETAIATNKLSKALSVKKKN